MKDSAVADERGIRQKILTRSPGKSQSNEIRALRLGLGYISDSTRNHWANNVHVALGFSPVLNNDRQLWKSRYVFYFRTILLLTTQSRIVN